MSIANYRIYMSLVDDMWSLFCVIGTPLHLNN
jgi:hypothetical protein